MSTWLAGMRTAPVLVVVLTSKDVYLDRYAEDDKGWADRDENRWAVPYWHVDAGMAALLMLQTAVDDGLGACFFGVAPGEVGRLRPAFGIPDAYAPTGVVAVGHTADRAATGSPRRRARKPLDDVVHRGRWEGGRHRGDDRRQASWSRSAGTCSPTAARTCGAARPSRPRCPGRRRSRAAARRRAAAPAARPPRRAPRGCPARTGTGTPHRRDRRSTARRPGLEDEQVRAGSEPVRRDDDGASSARSAATSAVVSAGRSACATRSRTGPCSAGPDVVPTSGSDAAISRRRPPRRQARPVRGLEHDAQAVRVGGEEGQTVAVVRRRGGAVHHDVPQRPPREPRVGRHDDHALDAVAREQRPHDVPCEHADQPAARRGVEHVREARLPRRAVAQRHDGDHTPRARGRTRVGAGVGRLSHVRDPTGACVPGARGPRRRP